MEAPQDDAGCAERPIVQKRLRYEKETYVILGACFAVYREKGVRVFGGGVMIDAHAYPSEVLGQIINAVRRGASEVLNHKVMDAALLGVALGP